MAKASRFSYIGINKFEGMGSIEIASIEQFISLMDLIKAPVIFMQESTDTAPEYTMFCTQGDTLLVLAKQAWKRLEDFEDAKSHGFEKARDYYEAQSLGFTEFRDFDECRQAGLTDKTLFNRAQKGGYIEGFPLMMEKLAGNRTDLHYETATEVKQLKNSIELLQFAEKKGFNNYKEFERAVLKGFTSLAEYTEATRLHFEWGNEYRKAMAAGFADHSEYKDAHINNIHVKREYVQFKKLKQRAKNNGMDEVLLADYVASLQNGTKVSLTKIEDKLHEVIKPYQHTEEGKEGMIFDWFIRRLFTRQDIINFLTGNAEVRASGMYDGGGEYFEAFKIRESKVFVDASNVAHYNGGRPELKKVFIVAKALRDDRFPNVVVIADASLRHKVSDLRFLKNLEGICSYMEAPAGSSADEFLIKQARRDSGFIVTNDTFRDWKPKDAWVAEHIDDIRIPFMIQNEMVTFSLMEKFGKNGENGVG
jgi:hypothetical protein